jgi:hypothetical protein
VSLLLGLRLAVAGGRESLLRLAFTAIGAGVGMALLLLALTGQAAIMGRAERIGWQDAAYAAAGIERPVPAAESADGALFVAVSDYYDGQPMTRAYVAALGDHPPVPAGLARLPGPGEVAVSPAMRRLLESTPDDQLDARFPGRPTLTIGAAGLAHANERVAIIGRTPDQLRDVGSVREVRNFHTVASGIAFFWVIRAILLIGALFVLVPVVVHVVVVTRVAAAQRERRLAAIRLVGATRLQTAAVAAAETVVAAAAGSVLGWAGYEAGRRILAATVSYQGGHFYLEDLAVGPMLLVLVLAGVPVLAVLTTIASLRRVQVSPLGINRRGYRTPPSVWTALPLAGGVAGQLALGPLREILGERALVGMAQVFALLQIVGLVLVGPWLCMMAGHGVARLSRRAPGLIAARRIADDPWATFRAVIGVVLAAFAVAFIGSVVQQVETRSEAGARVKLRPGVVEVNTGGVPADQVGPLLSGGAVAAGGSPGGLVVPCEQLSRVRYVSCPFPPPDESGLVEPAPGAENWPVQLVYVPTDGTLAAENRVRTRAANLVPNAIINSDRDLVDRNAVLPGDLGRLAQIGCLFALLVGACSLAAGMIGGVVERRRPFALLRASGMRLADLRRVVFLETAVTMALTSAMGVVLGVLCAYALSRLGDLVWQWPDLAVFGYVAGGILAALLLSTLTLPLLDATTRHDAVRYE